MFWRRLLTTADSRHSEVMETIWWGVIPCKISINQNLSEIPSSQKRQLAKPLAYYENKYGERDTAIVKSYESGAYNMSTMVCTILGLVVLLR